MSRPKFRLPEDRDDEADEECDDTCSDCQGTGIGWAGPESSCSSCGGRGYDKPERDPDDWLDEKRDREDCEQADADARGNYGGPL